MAKNGVIGFYHGTWYVSLTFLGELVKLSQEMVYFALKYGTHYITKWPQYSYLVHFQGEFQFKEGFTNKKKKWIRLLALLDEKKNDQRAQLLTCFKPSETVYSSSSLDIPKSEIFTIFLSPTRQFLAAKSLWIQFFDSRYCIPAAASKHMPEKKLVIFFSWKQLRQLLFYLIGT